MFINYKTTITRLTTAMSPKFQIRPLRLKSSQLVTTKKHMITFESKWMADQSDAL